MITLEQYYESLGYRRSGWHIGHEHPYLEQYAIGLLQGMRRAKILEVGYQAGGFAVPVILAMRDRPSFSYLGIDSLGYENAVEGRVIAKYLQDQGVTSDYEFATGDAGEFLAEMPTQEFDLVLIDHYKALYPRDFRTIVRRGLVSLDGYVLFHDVLGKARDVWEDCLVIARTFGYSSSIVSEVPEGLGVVKRDRFPEKVTFGQRMRLGAVNVKINLQHIRALARRLRRRM